MAQYSSVGADSQAPKKKEISYKYDMGYTISTAMW